MLQQVQVCGRTAQAMYSFEVSVLAPTGSKITSHPALAQRLQHQCMAGAGDLPKSAVAQAHHTRSI